MRRQVLSLLVENTSGVLSHISGLFSRRAFNIDSFSAGVTADERFTRITIVSTGEESDLEQIQKQLAKLEDVVDIKELRNGDSVCRELLLVKVAVDSDNRRTVLDLVDGFRANVLDWAHDSLIIELTGDQGKLNAFLTLLDEYEILELARTGFTGLSRGTSDVVILD